MSSRFPPSLLQFTRNLALRGILLLLFVLSFPRSSMGQTWKALGPAGGDARVLAAAPSDSQIVYLGSTDGHIFISRDAGEHWQLAGRTGAGSNAIVTSILVDPRDPKKLFASAWTKETSGEAGGIFASLDGGRSWRAAGLAGHAVRALVVAPPNPANLVAGALDGVFRSQDGGETWQRISPEDDPEIRNVDSLAVDPQNPETIYAGTFHLPWKTRDGGAHWTPIQRGMIDDSDVLSIAVDPGNSSHLLASTCSGIYSSADAGELWQKIQGIPYSSRRTLVIRMDPASSEIIYAGTTEGLWESANGGASWQRISASDWIVYTLAILRPAETERSSSGLRGEERLLVGTEHQGILLSDDAGRNFRAANDGFFHRRIISLAGDPAVPAHIAAVVANAPVTIVESLDGGDTWLPLGHGGEIPDAKRIFWTPTGWRVSLASGGLARWDDANGKWARVADLRRTKTRSPAAAPEDGVGGGNWPLLSVVSDLAFSESRWFAATADGIRFSKDGGASWSALPAAAFQLPADSIRVSRDGLRLRAVSSRGMIFSDDGGQTAYWRDLPLDSGGAQRVEFVRDGLLMATSPTGLYMSRDDGASWARVQNGLPAAPVLDIVWREDFWLAESKTGDFYLSSDRGLNWQRLPPIDSTDFNERPAQAATVTRANPAGSLYAPSGNDGLFLLDLQESPSTLSLVTPDK